MCVNLYTATLLSMFIISKRFYGVFNVSYIYNHIWKKPFIPFPVTSFISISSCTAPAKSSSTTLNSNGEGELLYLVPNFSENALSFSPFTVMLTAGL